jgi:uncharacterized protein YebE (UPF0316 family)
MSIILGYALIFFARVADVTLATIRTLMVVQSRKMQAAIVGFFEVGIYITVLGKVVTGLDNPMNLLAYCAGFATGNIVGITIENKIALGNLAAQIILKTAENHELVTALRDNGFGVTIIQGEGINGPKEVLSIALNRKDLKNLKNLVYSFEKDAFITVSSINPVSGGYFSTIKK